MHQNLKIIVPVVVLGFAQVHVQEVVRVNVKGHALEIVLEDVVRPAYLLVRNNAQVIVVRPAPTDADPVVGEDVSQDVKSNVLPRVPVLA